MSSGCHKTDRSPVSDRIGVFCILVKNEKLLLGKEKKDANKLDPVGGKEPNPTRESTTLPLQTS